MREPPAPPTARLSAVRASESAVVDGAEGLLQSPKSRMWGQIAAFARDPVVGGAVSVWLLSRICVLAFMTLGAHFTVYPLEEEAGIYGAAIRLGDPSQVIAQLQRTVLIADAGWYVAIAETGYEAVPFDDSQQRSWAFFPLFPVVWGAATRITHEYALTGMVLSHVFFLSALIAFARLVDHLTKDRELVSRAVFYLGFAPSSYFFSLPLTESLYLLLSVTSLSAAQGGQWWRAGVLGTLGAATRPAGILLFPTLLIARFESLSRRWYDIRSAKAYLPVFLVPIGLLVFMWYLGSLTGNPWAFRDSQAAWGRTFGVRSMVQPFVEYMLDPGAVAAPWSFTALNVCAAAVALAAGVILAVQRRWPLAFYTLSGVLLPLSTLSLGSMARFVVVLFPVFIALAFVARRPFVDQALRVAFVALLAVMAGLFGAHINFSLA
jgi:hypothetical protein